MVLHFQNITQFYRINVDIHYEMRSAGISCFMNQASNHAGWFEPYNVIVAIFEQTQGRCKMKLGEKKKVLREKCTSLYGSAVKGSCIILLIFRLYSTVLSHSS